MIDDRKKEKKEKKRKVDGKKYIKVGKNEAFVREVKKKIRMWYDSEKRSSKQG